MLLVVGLRLGCLNHALLSEQSILASGSDLLGWVGSQVEPEMACLAENLATLEGRLTAPCLGTLLNSDSAEPMPGLRPLQLEKICGMGQG